MLYLSLAHCSAFLLLYSSMLPYIAAEGPSYGITHAQSVVPNHNHAQNVDFLAGFLDISLEHHCFKRITSFIFMPVCCLTR